MDARVFDKKKLPSRHVTVAPARARMHQPRGAGDKVALVADGRSGAMRGFCVGHVGPEAAVGEPVALSDVELSERRWRWKPRSTDYGSGAIWTYAQTVGSARDGAVTHPGFAGETHVYADL